MSSEAKPVFTPQAEKTAGVTVPGTLDDEGREWITEPVVAVGENLLPGEINDDGQTRKYTGTVLSEAPPQGTAGIRHRIEQLAKTFHEIEATCDAEPEDVEYLRRLRELVECLPDEYRLAVVHTRAGRHEPAAEMFFHIGFCCAEFWRVVHEKTTVQAYSRSILAAKAKLAQIEPWAKKLHCLDRLFAAAGYCSQTATRKSNEAVREEWKRSPKSYDIETRSFATYARRWRKAHPKP